MKKKFVRRINFLCDNFIRHMKISLLNFKVMLLSFYLFRLLALFFLIERRKNRHRLICEIIWKGKNLVIFVYNYNVNAVEINLKKITKCGLSFITPQFSNTGTFCNRIKFEVFYWQFVWIIRTEFSWNMNWNSKKTDALFRTPDIIVDKFQRWEKKEATLKFTFIETLFLVCILRRIIIIKLDGIFHSCCALFEDTVFP